MEINKQIIGFLKKHHVMTLATCQNNIPWCCNIFYAYAAEQNLFIFTSSSTTRHIEEILSSSFVSVAIAEACIVVDKLRGIQMQGQVEAVASEHKEIFDIFYKRFPFARLKPAPLWIIRPSFFKYTDNRLGFGKKIYWSIENESSV